MDYIKRYVSDAGLRLSVAVTTGAVDEAVKRHNLWPVSSAALGRTITGALLLAGDFKNQESVSIRISGGGPIGAIHADAFSGGRIRGYVEHPHVDIPLNSQGKLDVGAAVGINGDVSVTRFTGMEQNYSSRSALVSGEIAEDLAYYLYISEQVPSTISLGVLVSPENRILTAGGFLVQALPEANEEALITVENNISTIGTVTNYLLQYKSGEGLPEAIFKGLPYKEVYEDTVQFGCTCSKERFSSILITLPEKDKSDILMDDVTELVCHYCNNRYTFTREELSFLFNNSQK